MDMRGIKRFARYASVGVSTFLLDLALIYAAVTYLHAPYAPAVFVSFLIAVSCNYALSRAHVFKGSERKWHHGYASFMGVALIAASVTTGLATALVSLLGVQFLVARTIIAGLVGMGNYLFNLYVNFKVAGSHR
ncbi:GtrA family protein [Candidatus Kaiserbacteria bacterium]|nr:GtrA family protein [Candidatus Kaiserbacteria bacterium]